MRSYRPLAKEQRYQISMLRGMNRSQKEIADRIGVHPATVSRELRRNSRGGVYCPETAHERSVDRRRQARKAKTMTEDRWLEIESKLREEWSPEQISGWMLLHHCVSVSHTWIYERVKADMMNGGDLYRSLRFGKKRRPRWKKSSASSHRIPNRVGIEDRPAIVDRRERIGDWEGDTVAGRNRKSCLVTLAERVSRLTLMAKVPRKYADQVRDRMIELLGEVRDWAHTLTLDNGVEFVEHERVAKALSLATYFARPYRSCDRGLNENMNGLIRQYFPKRTDFDDVADDEISMVQRKLNNRPRKCLGFRTPAEVFMAMTGIELV